MLDLLFERSPRGWFEMPWRSGVNAARIPTLFLTEHSKALSGHSSPFWWLLNNVFRNGAAPEAIYEQAALFIQQAQTEIYKDAAHCYGRILQLYASNSHGGGHSYNVLLESFATSQNDDAKLEEAVKRARCYDAIGDGFLLRNDAHDRARSAFLSLWERGHHRAIYALPHLERT